MRNLVDHSCSQIGQSYVEVNEDVKHANTFGGKGRGRADWPLLNVVVFRDFAI